MSAVLWLLIALPLGGERSSPSRDPAEAAWSPPPVWRPLSPRSVRRSPPR